MGDDRRRAGTINPAQVVGGAAIGLVSSWLLFAFAGLIVYATLGDHATTWVDTLVGFTTLFAIPVCAGIVLIRRCRGQLGSGMLLGVAIGSLIGAGVCTSLMYAG
jgi:hypothetical protein